MPIKDTNPPKTTPETAFVAPATLPPVPGGGSWRPNAAGDGWLENTPAADPAPATTLKTQTE